LADKVALYLKTKNFHRRVGRLQRIDRDSAADVEPARALGNEEEDLATDSLIEDWIGEVDGRAWFLCAAPAALEFRITRRSERLHRPLRRFA
jgi:DNA-binding ferritin-like protein